MGGKEASRGFLYQGIISVLRALTDEHDWDKIYVEFPTSNDKVDIALEQQNQIIKCIQVKSTINIFSKSNIKTWIEELIKDVESLKYELFLIGQCNQPANTFIKSIGKYYDNELDEEAKSSLNGFDTDLLDNKTIQITVLSHGIESLQGILRDLLHQYISQSNRAIKFEPLSLIASALINDQVISSTHGKGIDRKKFDEELEKRILLIADKNSSKRVSIGVESFINEAESLEKMTKSCLSLIDKFDGRYIKEEYDWNNDIYKELKKFLLENTINKDPYQLFLKTHSSIAFASGRILHNKLGVDVFPMQISMPYNTLWDVNPSTDTENYSKWDFRHEKINENQYDTALILNVTHNIRNDVLAFIEEKNFPIGSVINCTLPKNGAVNFSIMDGTHASFLANSIYNAISSRSITERRATLHIFASAPNGFMFFLGQNSLGFGKCILYEYDFEQRNSCTYWKSISFTD